MSQGAVIRAMLVGLPLGLAIMGVVSLYYTHGSGSARSPKKQGEDARSVAAAAQQPIRREDLEKAVSVLATDIGQRNAGTHYDNLKTAAYYIQSTLGPNNLGYNIRLQTLPQQTPEVWNVEAELGGVSRPREIVIIGAHYDSVAGSPGADDNATGVAALLGLARAFAGTENERTLRFVAFVNEEPPYFQTDQMGSLHYASDCREKKENIVAMLSLESLGYFSDQPGSQKYPPGIREHYPDTGNFIAFVGNVSAGPLVEQAAGAFTRATAFPVETAAMPAGIPGIGWSDHWSFWQAGYPDAIMITDTPAYRNPNYHQAGDVPGTLDFPRFTEVVKGLQGVVEELANPGRAPKPN